MAQKIFAGRFIDSRLAGGGPDLGKHDLVEVKVDQVVLARSPMRAFAEGLAAGLKKTPVEVAIAYEGRCVTEGKRGVESSLTDLMAHGVFVARPGVGFPNAVHLERFASPARLCVTDEPRLAGVGGVGMLALVVPPGLLGHALAHGSVMLRPPRSVQVSLSGRMRPFVCARDLALELMRRGLGDIVRRVEEQNRAPVVLEFTGPSARLLSVAERSVLASIAPQLGAAGALFVSDERTEVFLRDQRRSKAHRALVPDAGAPCDDVMNVDLGAVDPLLLDERGQVRAVRDLAGRPVSQVLLGGDSGVTLRDLFAAATLLKSKRVPPRLDLLLAVPSRQMLEVLASTGALTDLIATGARLIEPDARVVTGGLYPPAPGGASLRTCDPEPRLSLVDAKANDAKGPAGEGAIVASAETLAYAVATGEIGDPRAFKRPVRVTVPRVLPTDDVLVVRERRGSDKPARATSAAAPKKDKLPVTIPAPVPWKAAQTLEVIDGVTFLSSEPNGKTNLAVVCATLDEVRHLAANAPELAGKVRAVLAPFIPSGIVGMFSGVGIAAIAFEPSSAKGLKGQKSIALPAPSAWGEAESMSVSLGGAKVPMTWLARGVERAWVNAGTVTALRAGKKSA